jgi:hypothetical protein
MEKKKSSFELYKYKTSRPNSTEEINSYGKTKISSFGNFNMNLTKFE